MSLKRQQMAVKLSVYQLDFLRAGAQKINTLFSKVLILLKNMIGSIFARGTGRLLSPRSLSCPNPLSFHCSSPSLCFLSWGVRRREAADLQSPPLPLSPLPLRLLRAPSALTVFYPQPPLVKFLL